MDFKDIKKSYGAFEKKYSLPAFKVIHDNFELQGIEHEEYFLRTVRRKVANRVSFFLQILEMILYPNGQSAIAAYESGHFSDEKKHEMQEVHKELMVYIRESLSLDILGNEKKDAEYISKMNKVWPKYKKILHSISQELEETWKKSVSKEGGAYFG